MRVCGLSNFLLFAGVAFFTHHSICLEPTSTIFEVLNKLYPLTYLRLTGRPPYFPAAVHLPDRPTVHSTVFPPY